MQTSTLERMGGMSEATTWLLPDEVLALIFSFLPAEDIGRVACVCSRWSQVAKDRRVWRGKNFSSEGGRGLSDVLPIARALPVLKRVSVCWGRDPYVYLSGEFADFVVPDLRDEAVTSALLSLVTENLLVDFYLLEERCGSTLVVQLHELKQLTVCTSNRFYLRDTVLAKLRALGDALSSEPLTDLLSVDIDTDSPSMELDVDGNSDILGALSTCSALEHLTINTRCSLSWRTVTEFLKLQFLQLQRCFIEDISFLDLCPNLRSLSLEDCSPLGRRELSRVSELRSLILRHLSITTELVDTLCKASPKLERISLDGCPYVVDTLFLGHCPQLRFVEVNRRDRTSSPVLSLPAGLQHLRLKLPLVTSDSLAEILQGVPRLEMLDVRNCNIESLRFLCHCPHLLGLSVVSSNTYQHFCVLQGLIGLKKLHLVYNDSDVGPLADTLCKMPQLEALTVLFMKSISNLPFLRYCHQLDCLELCFYFRDGEHLCFHELSNLKRLRKFSLLYRDLGVEDLEDFLPSLPNLKELYIGCMFPECNFSFLRHCCQLTSFEIHCQLKHVSHLTQLRQLQCLRRLTVRGLLDEYRQSLAEELIRLPKLEYLRLKDEDRNFLKSWEWHKMLSSLNLSA